MGVEEKAMREVIKILQVAAMDVDLQLRTLEGKEGVGAIVRRTQLSAARVSVLERLAQTWGQLGEVATRHSLEAATEAVRANGKWDEDLLKRMGLSAEQRSAFQAGLEISSRNAVQLAINRNFDTTGKQNIPLSQRVYQSAAHMNGLVTRKIESALVRGLNHRELAKEVRDFIRPDVPGGVGYAAKRLARTEINHAYHYAQIENNKDKPWVTGMRWRISGSHPRTDICDSMGRDDHSNLGAGVYPKESVPGKPHPQCLCSLVPETLSEEEFMRRANKGEFNGYMQKKVPGLNAEAPSATPDPAVIKKAPSITPKPAGIKKAPSITPKPVPGTKRTTAPKAKPVPAKAPVKAPAPAPVKNPIKAPVKTAANNPIVDESRAIEAALDRQRKLVPKSMAEFGGINNMDAKASRAFASRHGSSALGGFDRGGNVIHITKQIFSPRYQKSFEKDRRTGWFSKSGPEISGLDNFISHEVGHYLHNRALIKGPNNTKEIWESAAQAFDLNEPFFFDAHSVDRWVMENQKVLAKKVSKYGATESAELLAEIWAEYTTNPNASAGIKKIGKAMAEAAERVET
jgi:hypothetical protein